MSKQAVDAVFRALFTLTDVRVLLRETAPYHVLEGGNAERARKLLQDLKKDVALIEQELVR
jgi:hypothetical protein